MTREEELIRLLVRESIKDQLAEYGVNDAINGVKNFTTNVVNAFKNKPLQNAQNKPLTPQDAKIQWDNHNRPEGDPLRTKINDPNRLKKIQDIVNKNFPQSKQAQKQNYNAFDDDREANNHSAKMKSAEAEDPWSHEDVPAPVARTQYGQVGRAAESRKRRKAALR